MLWPCLTVTVRCTSELRRCCTLHNDVTGAFQGLPSLPHALGTDGSGTCQSSPCCRFYRLPAPPPGHTDLMTARS